MGKLYLSIDPGKKGFITAQCDGEFSFIPLENCDWSEVFDEVSYRVKDNPNCVCVIEDVHAIYGSSAEATFNFGYVCGMLKMMLVSLRIPYVMVQPKTWQKEIWINQDIVATSKTITRKDGTTYVKKDVDTKSTSINAAKRLYPGMDFRKDTSEKSRCKNIDDNKVDSVLMNLYAVRKNL